MNYFYIYAIIYPNSNKKPKNVWYSPHLFVPLSDARRYSRSTIKAKKSFFVLYCAHLFVPLSPDHWQDVQV